MTKAVDTLRLVLENVPHVHTVAVIGDHDGELFSFLQEGIRSQTLPSLPMIHMGKSSFLPQFREEIQRSTSIPWNIVLWDPGDLVWRDRKETAEVVYRAVVDRELDGRRLPNNVRLILVGPKLDSVWDEAILNKMIVSREEA